MDLIIHTQKEAIKELQRKIVNFNKDNKTEKSKPEYFSRRIVRLDSWWIAFDARHTSLGAARETNHKYFTENLYESTKNLYHKHRQELQDGLVKVAPSGYKMPLELNEIIENEDVENGDEDDELNAILDSTLKDFMETSSTMDENLENASTSFNNTNANDQARKNASLSNPEAEILKVLYQEIIELIQASENMDTDARPGLVQAQLDMLKETWTTFRSHYYNLRAANNPVSTQINMTAVQLKYTIATGHLNELFSQDNNTAGLPKLKIPEFNGKQSEWRTFIELFNKIVHEKNISVSYKMQYLKSSLKGQAAGLVAHLSTADQYESCLEILYKRYDNKRRLLGDHLDNILNLPRHVHESSSELRKLLDVATESMLAIKNLGFDTNNWDPIISHILIKKLNEETSKHYECQLRDIRESPTLKEFLTYVENRYLAIQSVETKNGTQNFANYKKEKEKTTGKNSSFQNLKCVLCDESHVLRVCQKFLSKEVNERNNFVKSKKLCINCLSSTHNRVQDCKSKFACKSCNRKHNSLLHFESVKANVVKVTDNQAASNEMEGVKNAVISVNSSATNSKVLLATALVSVRGKNGENYALRVLVDQGSQSSFITEGAVQLLKLQKMKQRNRVSGINSEEELCNFIVDLQIGPRFTSSFILQTKAIVLKNLVNLKRKTIQYEQSFNHLNNLHLADPSYRESGQIDILIGAAEHAKIIKSGLIKGSPDEPIAQNSEFGWIISGPTSSETTIGATVTSLLSVIDIEERIKEFFKHDDIAIEVEPLNGDELLCEEHFKKNTVRLENGRYSIKLPFKNGKDKPILGDSRKCAVATLIQLEKRFQRNPKLAEEYKKFIHEYLSLGHMELSIYDPNTTACYLPHHCVLRDSTTTKLRVVFNASQKTSNGVSLNDELAVGAIDQTDMNSIMLNFRTYKYAFSADLEKMYRQVIVDESQRDYQKILWRDSPNLPISEYRLKTITYGMANAPYLARRIMQQIGFDCEIEHPNVSRIIRQNMYVDDVITGAHTEEEAIERYTELRYVFCNAGFNLRKWSSNSKKLLAKIPEIDRELKAETSNVKALGISWSPTKDCFTYKMNLEHHSKPFTKRLLLSEISSLFDPLGWICPIVISAKILVQELWKIKLDWDEVIPGEIANQWLKIKSELHIINDINVYRWINYSPNDIMELHGFGDACKFAFGAVIFVKNVTRGTVRLLIAKNRVTPLKLTMEEEEIKKLEGKQQVDLTIPKLELCAANLLAKLTKGVLKALNINFNKIYLWSDSKIVIDWIHGNPKRYKTFVANRISAIDKYVGTKNWYHVRTGRNPADCASRGMLPTELMNHDMWWNGPSFLHENEYSMASDLNEIDPAIESLALNVQIIPKENILPDVSSFEKMKRIVAYCLRFAKLCKSKTRNSTPISADEMKSAELAIIKIVQGVSFDGEINNLKKKKEIKINSNILNLSVFLDKAGILRVGGRLRNADMEFDRKHQILLPRNNSVTNLIIRHFHLLCLHGGPKATETILRQKFWVVNSKTEIKKVLLRCIPCFKQKQKTMMQVMADLPANRVNIVEKPFTNVAVDYTGAISYKLAKGRAGKIAKSYICIFVCMATKAMHIELVSDMTADAFLAAVRRLVARRGMVKSFNSDNGTNFVRAEKDLSSLFEIETEEFQAICSELAKRGISWHFSPAGAPHFNGLAEAAVKVVKAHLIKTIGTTALTFEELATLLYQIEACANSRPLCALSSDPNDTEVLTPGHFLIGAPLLAAPDESYIETKTNWLSRWQLVQKLNQTIWKKFQDEYLHELQTKTKWFTKNEEPQVNDLVLVRDENTPPCKWPLARIIDVHKGDDKLTRVVTLRMRNNTFKRPITKIAPLPINNNTETTAEIQSHVARVVKPKQNFNVIPVITALLAIFLSSVNASANEIVPFTINNFDKPPGIYFEQMSSVRFSYTSWNSVVYINLNAFFNDAEMIKRNYRDIKNICEKKLSGHGSCKTLTQLIEHRLNDIDERNELIMTFKHHRVKRALLDAVGNIAHDLFGVLDSNFAREYVLDMSKLEANDEHLLALLKNHTSILNSTMNIIKKDENEIILQRENIMSLAETIRGNGNEQQTAMYFHTMTTYNLHLISDYERQQDSLLDVLTGARKNHIDHNLLSPAQVKKQINLMSDHLSETLTPPDEADFYKLATITPFVTNNTLFFRISIPLLNDERFQMFRVYPVPFIQNGQVFTIKTKYEIIIASISRQRYQLIQKKRSLNCKPFRQGMAICFGPRNWLTSQVSTCEWELLIFRSNKICEIIPTTASNLWTELEEPNKWLYFVNPITKLISICNERVAHHTISGCGTLQLNNECILRTEDQEIIPKNDIENAPNEFIVPSFTINLTAFEQMHKPASSTHDFVVSNVTDLQLRLKSVEEQSKLPDKLNAHDLHHYSISYLMLIFCCTLIYFIVKRFRYSPMVRPKSISLPNLTADLARRLDHRFSAPENV